MRQNRSRFSNRPIVVIFGVHSAKQNRRRKRKATQPNRHSSRTAKTGKRILLLDWNTHRHRNVGFFDGEKNARQLDEDQHRLPAGKATRSSGTKTNGPKVLQTCYRFFFAPLARWSSLYHGRYFTTHGKGMWRGAQARGCFPSTAVHPPVTHTHTNTPSSVIRGKRGILLFLQILWRNSYSAGKFIDRARFFSSLRLINTFTITNREHTHTHRHNCTCKPQEEL